MIFTLPLFAFDMENLNKELLEIDQNFLKDQVVTQKKQEINTNDVLNLEEKYFDQISTKKSGIQKHKTRSRD